MQIAFHKPYITDEEISEVIKRGWISSVKLEEIKGLGDYIGRMLSSLINSIKKANSN